MSRKGGETAMRHARAWIKETYPGAPVLSAQQAVVWIPDGSGGRRPISRQEDLFACFDFLVLWDRVTLLQVTTWGSSAETSRKRKIEGLFLHSYRIHPETLRVGVLAYRRRRGFYAWWWEDVAWSARYEYESPLLRRPAW